MATQNVGSNLISNEDGFPYYFAEQKRKNSDSLHRRVRSRVADRCLPTHRMAIQNAGTNNISNEGSSRTVDAI
ncbi:hypothetical protein Tco_1216518 [Tanacetum coccineum]